VAELAARDEFSGVVPLSHRGRTVLSRSYGTADEERGIRNHEDIAFTLSSASRPFLSVAILQLVQRGAVALSDTVGDHLTGFAAAIADQVTVHHRRWTRQAELVAVPGSSDNDHRPGGGAALAIAAQIVEAVSGTTFWDHVHEHVFERCGMTGSAYHTRHEWLTDEHIAHPYVRQADGSRVDAVRNLDRGGLHPLAPGRNPGRGFIGYSSGDGFATAPDLVRFANALRDGTVLNRPHADLFTGAELPGHDPTSYVGYTMPVSIVGDRWTIGRGGGSAGGRGHHRCDARSPGGRLTSRPAGRPGEDPASRARTGGACPAFSRPLRVVAAEGHVGRRWPSPRKERVLSLPRSLAHTGSRGRVEHRFEDALQLDAVPGGDPRQPAVVLRREGGKCSIACFRALVGQHEPVTPQVRLVDLAADEALGDEVADVDRHARLGQQQRGCDLGRVRRCLHLGQDEELLRLQPELGQLLRAGVHHDCQQPLVQRPQLRPVDRHATLRFTCYSFVLVQLRTR
jgi:CubicO group peptidase (beta-lactamase class C family)